MKRGSAQILHWLVPMAALAAWEITARFGILPPYLSAPSLVLLALWETIRDGELVHALAPSVFRVALGFAIGTVTGIIGGLGAGLVPGLRNFFDPLVSLLYSVPKVAFLPVFLLLFGIGDVAKIAIIAFSGFFPVFVASRHAVASIDPHLVWTAKNMGAPPRAVFFRVIIPAAAPELFAGVRIGLAHAFVLLFAAELIGGSSGIGTLINAGEEWGRFDLMLAGVVCFALLGFGSDRILLLIRRRVLKGHLIGTQEQVLP
jgi:ABC-type nitrate/sulfonate/bicarbonate transport system permease component